MNAAELTDRQRELYAAIGDQPLLVAEIAHVLGVDPSTLGPNLGRLERAGLITRDPYKRYHRT